MSTNRWFTIDKGTPERRQQVREFLPHLDRVDNQVADLIVAAWTTVWSSSVYADIAEAPYTLLAPEYRLVDHVREVCDIGVMLAEYRSREWSDTSDPNVLVAALLLHDLDKPLLYVPQSLEKTGSAWGQSRAAEEVPHGVLGGMITRELGLDDRVTALVTTHAANAPFHSATDEGWLLHYADFISCDHALAKYGEPGVKPFYQKHWTDV